MKMHEYLISRMSPALNRTTVLQHFERSNAVKIHNRIMFDSYLKVVVSGVQFFFWFRKNILATLVGALG